MKRKIIKELIEWQNSETRKPLMITGMHGVGKTDLVINFGNEHYQDVVYFNLREELELIKILDREVNIENLMKFLSFLAKKKIIKKETLVILDDVDNYVNILSFLTRVCLNDNDYHIIAISSVLPSLFGKTTNYVGNVIFKKMYPLDFEEFLNNIGQAKLVSYIRDSYITGKKMPFHDYALKLFQDYLLVGGLPLMIEKYKENEMYITNMNKEIIGNLFWSEKKLENTKIINMFDSIPYQLLEKNKKFKYNLIKKGARQTEYLTTRKILKKYDIVIEAYKIKDFSRMGENDDFKIYMMDNSMLSSRYLVNKENVGPKYKEALIENYVGIELYKKGYNLGYFESDGIAEIPFVIQTKNKEFIPIEINRKVKSKNFNALSKKIKFEKAINVCENNFKYQKKIKNIPLYALFCLEVK